MKRIVFADTIGYCFGVERCVALTEKALSENEKVCCTGDLIHNTDEMKRLFDLGLIKIQAVDELPEDAVYIIRSHGANKATMDKLHEMGAKVVDTTCPKVRAVQRTAEAANEKGKLVLIIGDENHPEVKSVASRCAKVLVFKNPEQLETWTKSEAFSAAGEMVLIFQTTQTRAVLEVSKKLIKNLCTNCEVFDTICYATQIRQEEADKLSKRCDAMLVVGARHSANSNHLVKICREHCMQVAFVENAKELKAHMFPGCETVGITSGASVPAWILKEVKQTMCDEIKTQTEEEESFAELLENSLKTIYNGETVKGVVAAITPTEISVDLGTKYSGYIPVEDFTNDGEFKVEDLIKLGDTIEACVVRVNDVEGTVMLSKRRLDAVKTWSDIEAAVDNDTVLEGTVTEENKGGIVISVKGVRVFVPASQSGLPRDAEMSQLLRKKVRFKITEVNRGRKRVVGSIRAVAAKERQEKAALVWNEIDVGKRYEGVVKSLTSYGAFVDIGGVDGMVHVSELSWKRIGKPSDVINVGDVINVYVMSFDKENRKISLGYKDPNGNPWALFMNTYKVGDIAKVQVVKFMTFGAFAEVVEGVDGLIHISQIADRRIGKPEEVLTVGEFVDAKITAVDEEKRKVSLSIRALSEPEPAAKEADEVAPAAFAPESTDNDALVFEISETGEASGLMPEDGE